MKRVSDDPPPVRAGFNSMETSTKQDWEIIAPQYSAHGRALPDRILDHLRLLDGDFGGFPVDRLTHSLQTATLAHRNMRDAFRDHPHFARTEEFCARYDGPAFDAGADTNPLDLFEPMLRRVFAQPRESIYRTALE